MSQIQHIFRAYDIRGIFGQDLNVETMLKIGQAFGTYLGRKGITKITIGGDIRASTQTLLHVLIAGVSSTGISGEIVKQSPLGITLFHSFQKQYGASAFITASHLPPEWNGVKFYWGEGIGFSPEENAEIQSIFVGGEFTQVAAFKTGSYDFTDPFDNFVDYVNSKFSFHHKFKIALDCGNGATSLVVPELYERLGFEVLHLFSEPDPTFPNRPSEPNSKSLAQLSEFVKANDVDFAAGFDGDGDRCVILDENGRILTADEFGIIVAKNLIDPLSDRKSVIINMECSVTMEAQLKEIGADVHRIRVGHSFLSMKAKQINAIWGIEDSGHAIVPDVFLFDDALILPLVFADAIQKLNKKVSEITASIRLPVKTRFDLKCADNVKFSKLKAIIAYLKTQAGMINETDGASLTTNDGRLLVRVSNTSPKIRITIESESQTGFDALKDQFLEKIESLIN